MLIPISDIQDIFIKITQQLNIDYTSVLIFISLDTDSVCALRILTRLLKSQNIQYKVYPIPSYQEFNQKIEQCKIYQKVKLFFFINCGGIMDLTQKWFHEKAQVFLFDVNKPIHHKNIQDPNIRVIDDGLGQLQNHPTSEQMNRFQEIQQMQLDQEDIQEQQEQQQNQSQGNQERGPKRSSKIRMIKKLKKHKELLMKKIDNYYGKTYFSYPTSFVTYKLASQLNKIDNEYLWYAIVGTTSMLIQQKISQEKLETINSVLFSDMHKHNPVTQTKQKGSINKKLDFQFTLLRYWSLYQSMINSPYIITKFKLWDDKDFKKIDDFLLQIGISQKQAKQAFKFMSKQGKNKLFENIMGCSERFKIPQIVYYSFIRQVDFSTSFMASQYASAVMSVIQTPQAKGIDIESLQQHRTTCFWKAYQLFTQNTDTIIQQIETYKKTVQLINHEAINMIQRGHVIKYKSFYFANIRKDSQLKKALQHPYILIKLAYLLMRIQYQKKPNKSGPKPFIASLQDVQLGICTVVGVMGQQKNTFGTKFLQITQRLKINVKHDSFMANIMTIPKENLLQFVNELSSY